MKKIIAKYLKDEMNKDQSNLKPQKLSPLYLIKWNVLIEI